MDPGVACVYATAASHDKAPTPTARRSRTRTGPPFTLYASSPTRSDARRVSAVIIAASSSLPYVEHAEIRETLASTPWRVRRSRSPAPLIPQELALRPGRQDG